MRPPHRNFRYTQPVALCQKQNLRVETEALDALLLKNNLRLLPAKSLESALRIGKWNSHDPAHQAVKQDTRLFAHHGLANFDEGAVDGSRTDGRVIALFAQGDQ